MKYCGQCGYENADSARFCTECGAKLRVREEENVDDKTGSGTGPDGQTESFDKENHAYEAENDSSGSHVYESEEKQSEYAGSVSPLSVTGFVFAFLIAPIGFILELIDLCICDGRKKGLSIAGLIISLLEMTVIFFAVILPLTYIMS